MYAEMSHLPDTGVLYHPALGQVRYQLQEVADDPDTQVAQTIDLMRTYAQQDSRTPQVQSDVYQAWRSDDPVVDTFSYLKRDGERGMMFVRDERTAEPWSEWQGNAGRWRPLVESINRPELLAQLSNPQGDCDCFCTYGAAHLMLRGTPCSFATVAADDADPSMYSHVYLVAYPQSGPYKGLRVPMDLSHGPYPGWEVANRFGKLQEWPVSGGVGAWGGCGIAALVLAGGIAAYALSKRGVN